MKFHLDFLVHSLLCLSAVNLATGRSYIGGEERCEDESIACPCGSKFSYVSVPVKMCYSEKKGVCFPCHESERIICEKHSKCETCLPGLSKCFTCPDGASGPFCHEGASVEDNIYPIVFTSEDISDGFSGLDIAYGRTKRETKICSVPLDLKHSDYKCWKWPDRIKCDVHCHHGYAFPKGGTKQRLRCMTNEGKWTPWSFSECKPFMKCKVDIQSPGHYFCKYDMNVPSYCFFTCDATDTHPFLPRTKFICDGHWDPELPHCIKSVPDEDMLEPPGR